MNVADANAEAPAPRARRGALAPALALFGASLAYFLFWLHGQPFFDDNYTRWLVPARQTGAAGILAQIVTPVPGGWGFLNRPVILLYFKLFDACFGATPAWFYLGKAAIAAAAVVLLFLLGRLSAARLDLPSRQQLGVALVPPLLFVTAEPLFMSLLWLCDMEILSELCLLLAFALYLLYRAHGLHRRPLRPRAVLLQLLILCVAMIGFRTKSSARILPAVLFVHLLLVDRRALRHFLPLIGVLTFVNVPWATLARQPMPEFMSAAATAQAPVFFWRLPELQFSRDIFLGELRAFWPFSPAVFRPYGLVQLFLPFGWAAVLLAAIALVRARGRAGAAGRGVAASPPPTDSVALLAGIWLALALVTLPIYPRIGGEMLSRYLVAALLPAVLLLGALVGRAVASPGGGGHLRPLLIAMLLCQCVAGLFQTYLRKIDTGAVMVMIDGMLSHMENRYHDADIVCLGHGPYNYWPGTHGNRYFSVLGADRSLFDRLEGIAAQGRPVYLVTTCPQENPRWEYIETIAMPHDTYSRLLGMTQPRLARYVYRLPPPVPAPARP